MFGIVALLRFVQWCIQDIDWGTRFRDNAPQMIENTAFAFNIMGRMYTIQMSSICLGSRKQRCQTFLSIEEKVGSVYHDGSIGGKRA